MHPMSLIKAVVRFVTNTYSMSLREKERKEFEEYISALFGVLDVVTLNLGGIAQRLLSETGIELLKSFAASNKAVRDVLRNPFTRDLLAFLKQSGPVLTIVCFMLSMDHTELHHQVTTLDDQIRILNEEMKGWH
jgi:hypothetical protein